MKQNVLVTLVALALAGCAAAPGKQAWDVKPVMDVRHGMANSNAYYQLGRYQQSQGLVAEAEALYQRAVAADPKNADALNALGALYAERGDLERSAAIYRRVADLTPEQAYLYNNIGYTYHLQGRYGEAISAFRQALTLAPTYERAWINLRRSGLAAGRPEVVAQAEQRTLMAPGTPEQGVAAVVAQIPDAASPSLQNASDLAVRTLPAEQEQPARALVEPQPAHAAKLAEEASRPVGKSGGPILLSEAPVRHIGPIVLPEIKAQVGELASAPTPATTPVKPFPKTPIVKASLRPDTAEAAALPPARLEVSNGNGVTGFAAGVRMHLKMLGVGVSRLTNFVHFRVFQTVIEYRPGFVAQAEALRAKIGRPSVLREAKSERAGTDIRVIVGADWTRRASVLGEADEQDAKAPPA